MSLYDQLGLDPDATPEQITQAYRRLAQRHHPDRADGDQEKFLPIQAAYDTLGDSRKRKRYDETGATEIPHNAVDDKLMQLFNGMLSEEEEVVGDVVDQMRTMINDGIMGTDTNRAEIELKKAKLKKRRNRLKTKKSPNLFKQLADQQIAHCDQQIALLGEEIDLLVEVLDRLEDYEDVEPVVQRFRYTNTSTMP